MRKTSLCSAFTLVACLVSASDVMAAGADACSAASTPTVAPSFPEEMKGTGIGGEVLLRIVLGPCGRAESVEVQGSSGYEAFDASARQAASTWTLDRFEEGEVVLVPVSFSETNAEARSGRASTEAAFIEALLSQRKRMDVPAVALLADGTLPAFIPDPLPIEQSSVAEARAFLEANAVRQPDPAEGVEVYHFANPVHVEVWELMAQGFVFSPVAVRQRLATDGEKAFWVSAILCESSPDACERYREWLGSRPAQQALPPPPSPPPPPPPPPPRR